MAPALDRVWQLVAPAAVRFGADGTGPGMATTPSMTVRAWLGVNRHWSPASHALTMAVMTRSAPGSMSGYDPLGELVRTAQVVDLTAPLSSRTPVLPLPEGMAPIPPFALEELARYDERGETSYQNGIHTGEHVGTHFDAPCHWVTGRHLGDVASVPVSRLIAPAVVVDMSRESAQDPDFLLEVEHILAWQERHGPLPSGGWLLYRTGWDARSHDQELFLNADADGPHTPGVSAECARWLAEEAPIVGFGVETVGTDAGQAFRFAPPFPVHSFVLGAGKYGITQLQNLAELPAVGAAVVVAPLKIVNGSGSPARVLALVPNPASNGER